MAGLSTKRTGCRRDVLAWNDGFVYRHARCHDRVINSWLIVLFRTALCLQESEINGIVWNASIFNTTVIMSTYLTAFSVCDYTYVESSTQSGVEVKVHRMKNCVNAIIFFKWILFDKKLKMCIELIWQSKHFWRPCY